MTEPKRSVSDLWRIELLIETNDGEWIESLMAKVATLVCPHEDAEAHACDVPWFLTLVALDESEATSSRELLNR